MLNSIPSETLRRALLVSIFVLGSLLSANLFGPTGSAEKTGKSQTVSGTNVSAKQLAMSYGARKSLLSGRMRIGNLMLPPSTITVNTTAQNPGATGDCTLGEAIEAANLDLPVDGCSAGAGTDTIILQAGTYTLSVIDDTTATGLPRITSNVVIQGAGAATTIIERDPNASALFRLMAVTNSGSLTLSDVTLLGGRSDDHGGALSSDAATTLNNVVFTDNTAPNGGGAIVAGSTLVQVNNCTFENNQATNYYGGAIYAPTLNITGSTFRNNQAFVGGGAIFFNQGAGARVDITDSAFLNNSATTNNGGAILTTGVTTISGSTFDGNSAGNEGGAIDAARTLAISDSIVINNHANANKGGIAREQVATGLGGGFESLIVTRCNISNNTSNGRSGGVYAAGGSVNRISDSTISGNTAGQEGGGIFADNVPLNLTNDTIDGNTAARGGGISYQAGDGTSSLNLNNVTITGNHATNQGGGLFRNNDGDINLKNSIIALNISDSNFAPDIGAASLNSLGYNLIGIKDSGANYVDGTGDQTGTSANPLDPVLGALQDNGGSTFTRALLAGSTAIDAGNPAVPGSGGDACGAADQRATLRPKDGDTNGSARCDIGAFEVGIPQACVTPPGGMVGWWAFDGNADDIQGGNQALLFGGPSFVAGKVQQSLSFDGVDDNAKVPQSSAIDVGTSDGLTIDAWIKAPQTGTARPLIEWNNGAGIEGVHLWMSADFAEGGQGPGSIFVNLTDTLGTHHILSSAPNLLAPAVWQHVAVTYDKTSGVATIYLNGLIVAQQTLGTFTPQTSTDLYFGYRPVGVLAGRRFLGQMDEVELFNRALGDAAIQSIYDADSAGKCKPAPSPSPSPSPSVSSIAVISGSGVYSGTATLTATLSSGLPLSGKTVSFTLNSSSVGSATTDSNGVATLSAVSLSGINAGTYADVVGASFAGDANYAGSSGTGPLTVTKAGQTITVGTHAPASATYNTSFTVAATSDSGLAIAYSSAGDCTNVGATITMTSGTGSCKVKYNQAGDTNYNAATQVIEAVTAQKAGQTITFGTLAGKKFGEPDFAVSATSDSGLSVGFAATGNCTVSGNTVHLTGAGSCTITASQAGDSNYSAATSVDQSFTVARANQTITFGALANKTFGDPDFAVNATSNSGLAVSFSAAGNCTVSGNTVHLTGAGSCTITASQVGDGNYNAATPVNQSFTVATPSPSPTPTPTPVPVSFQFVRIGGPGSHVSSTTLSVNDGQVAFVGDASFGAGVFTALVADPNSVSVRYYQGGSVPGGRVFTGFEPRLSLNGDSVAFSASTRFGQTDPAERVAIYTDVRGSLELVADTSTLVPGGSETFTRFSSPWLYDGVVVFRGLGQSQDGIYAWSDGLLRTVADTNSLVPGGTSHFINFGLINRDGAVLGIPAVDDGVVVFTGNGSGGEQGVYKAAGSSLQVVADLNTPVPGGIGNFTGFGFDAVNIEGGKIVFAGLSLGQQGSIYASEGNSLTALVDTHTLVPGTNHFFTVAGNAGIGLSNGNISFLGDSNNDVFTTIGGSVVRVVDNGDVIDGQVVSEFGSYGRSLSGNLIGFNVGNFGDGVTGVQFATFVAVANTGTPTPTPTPRPSPTPSPDLSISMSNANDPVNLGSNVVYNISVSNTGGPADNVILTDDLPANTNFVSAVPSRGSCSQSNGTITCIIGTINNLSPATVAVQLTPTQTGTLTNTASVAATQWDPHTANNSASASTTVLPASADLFLTMSDAPDPVNPGDNITYTLNVKNNGPSPATGVILTGTLNQSLKFVSAAGCTNSGTTVTCNIGSLANGATSTKTIVVQTQVAGPIPNTASVSGTEADPNTGNNTATGTTQVNLPATPNANAAVKVITVMDNTNAPAAVRKQPQDFTVALHSVFAGNVGPELARVIGSASGTTVGVDAFNMNGFKLQVVNLDLHYVTTYNGCDSSISVGVFKTCTVTNTYTEFNGGGDEVGMRIIKVVENRGAPTKRQPSSFQMRVRQRNQVTQQFAGSLTGTMIGLNAEPFLVDEVNPEPNYVMTLSPECTLPPQTANVIGGSNNPGPYIIRHDGKFLTCTVTNTYVGTLNAGGHANATVKVITEVDNTNAPAAVRKQPQDFTVALRSVHLASELARFIGSSSGTTVGVDASLTTSFELRVVNPDLHYVTTYSSGCGGGSSISAGLFKTCTVTNTYADFNGGGDEAGVRIIKVVDNTGAPTSRQPGSFQMRVRQRQITQQFAGSSTGTVIGLNKEPFFVDEVTPDPNYVMTLSPECTILPQTASDTGADHNLGPIIHHSGEFHTCTVTNTYVGTLNAGGHANAMVKVITVMDNTNAPAAVRKQPQDFTVALHAARFGNVGSELARVIGSTSGTTVGVNASQVPGFKLQVVNLDPHYVTTYDGCDSSISEGLFKTCTVTNTYADFDGGGDEAGVRIIKVVDNTGAPTTRQPGSFQMRVRQHQITQQFAGSSTGTVIGLNDEPFDLDEVNPDPNYVLTLSPGCTIPPQRTNDVGGSSNTGPYIPHSGVFQTCIVTNTYLGTQGIATPAGSPTTVSSGGIRVTFDVVTTSGVTTTTYVSGNFVPILGPLNSTGSSIVMGKGEGGMKRSPEALPAGESVFNNLVFDVATSAESAAPITIAVDLSTVNSETLFNRLKILHDENGSLVDRTANRDFSTHTITATVDSLGSFVVVEDIDDTLPTITGHITDSLGHDVKDVVLTLAGPDVQSTTSDAAGNYSFVNLALGSQYAVIPLPSNFSLSPGSASFDSLSGSETVNFTLNNPTVAFESQSNTVAENGGVATITVIRGGDTNDAATVDYSTSDGTAQAGIDYAATAGTLTFDAGVASQNITIPITDNSLLDGDRTINLTLSNPGNGLSINVQSPVALTIIDDEGLIATTSAFGRSVVLGNVTVTYASVIADGFTSAIPINSDSAGPAPDGYTIIGPAYDITTSATYTAPVNVCFNLPSITDQATFSHLKVLHGETDANNQVVLIDRTTGLDFASHTVCSSVTSLSPFVIAQSQSPIAGQVTIRGQLTTAAGVPVGGATVQLSGAQSAFTVTDSLGRYSFENISTGSTDTVTPSLVNYTFTPANRTFSLIGNKLDAVFTAIPDAVPVGNPLDTASFFVRQHYLDFLGREPDTNGLAFWTNEITSCGTTQTCVDVKRINTSAAFFLSIEFQDTGYLVYRMYKSAYGNLPGMPVPLRLNEFTPDTRQIGTGVVVGVGDWQTQLETNKNAFALDFVNRPRFTTAYPTTLTPAQFVDGLYVNTGVTPSPTERSAAIGEFGTGTTSADPAARAHVLRRVAENSTFAQQEFNRAFVLTQYFGYLRRNPNDAPDADFSGYNFWLAKLNQFNGNFVNAEMVKAFLASTEYRRRFGP